MHKNLSASLIFCFGLLVCTAQAQTSSTDAEEQVSDSRPIEEINVTGRRTFLSMRNAIRRVEDSLYGLFNELNSDDSLDIHCKTVRHTSTHIRTRTCEPVFLGHIRQAQSREFMSSMRDALGENGELNQAVISNSMNLLESDSNLAIQLTSKYEQLNEEMLRIAMENEDYRNSLMQLGEMKAEYQNARKASFNSGPQ